MQDVKVSPTGIVIGLAGILILGVFGWLSFGPKPAPPPPPVLTQEAKNYLPNLALQDVHMQAAESMVNARLVEILGNIGNNGPRTIKLAQVTCVFSDYNNKEVKRERVTIIGASGATLPPGETKPFRLAFDDVPDTWNQALPLLAIAQIQFQ